MSRNNGILRSYPVLPVVVGPTTGAFGERMLPRTSRKSPHTESPHTNPDHSAELTGSLSNNSRPRSSHLSPSRNLSDLSLWLNSGYSYTRRHSMPDCQAGIAAANHGCDQASTPKQLPSSPDRVATEAREAGRRAHPHPDDPPLNHGSTRLRPNAEASCGFPNSSITHTGAM